MCGIAGIYNVELGQPVTVDLLKHMADKISHRGPDDAGYHVQNSLGLAHRRLSIIDLEGGHQPLTNEDQSVWVVFNGEIYNFQELRDELVQKNHVFKTRSDTEVIVHLYEEKGDDVFQYLRGMFAIALYDSRQHKLLLARDRVGKKPLFYHYDGKRVVFASEMKSILAAPNIPLDIDFQALSDYFSLLYIPAPKSIFQAVRKVLPGHYVVATPRGLQEKQYWDIPFEELETLSEKEWCERIVESLREAVRIRLISDVPLGAFLSGGIDSSAVVAMMSELTGEPVITTSIGFDDKEYDELNYARLMASRVQSRHFEEVVRPDAAEVVDKLVWHYDEPFADSSAVPTYYVSQLARKHVTVALSGDGGDEFFAGYRRYVFEKREQRLRQFIPPFLRRPVFGTLAALYPKADWAPRVLRWKATFESLSCSHIEGYFQSMSAVRPELKHSLLHHDVHAHLKDYDSLDVLRTYYDRAKGADPVARIQYVDVKTYLPDDILVKVDRASMAHSLEVRAPMLDHRFMELAASIPASMKLRGRSGKHILKKALSGILPHDILYRNKMGFAVPIAQWFRTDLKPMTYAHLFEGPSSNLLHRPTVRRIWDEHQNGLRNRATELWTILMFQLWQNRFRASA
jgi:asparagine synthase (glutamine-hydrolysing)